MDLWTLIPSIGETRGAPVMFVVVLTHVLRGLTFVPSLDVFTLPYDLLLSWLAATTPASVFVLAHVLVLRLTLGSAVKV